MVLKILATRRHERAAANAGDTSQQAYCKAGNDVAKIHNVA
jgi:hypothetical protein